MLRNIVARLIIAAVFVSVVLVDRTVTAARQLDDSTAAGCLQAGAAEGEFVLVVDDKLTYQIQPAEGLDLAPHANHRVELTGTIEKTETSAILKAKSLKMVATSCEA